VGAPTLFAQQYQHPAYGPAKRRCRKYIPTQISKIGATIPQPPRTENQEPRTAFPQPPHKRSSQTNAVATHSDSGCPTLLRAFAKRVGILTSQLDASLSRVSHFSRFWREAGILTPFLAIVLRIRPSHFNEANPATCVSSAT
jgi:hypothetical protein